MSLIRMVLGKVRGELDVNWYRRHGARIGSDVHIGRGVTLDPTHCNLLTLGDDVVFAPNVTLLTHDASLRRRAGFELTKLAPVTIGSRVFIGTGTVILPGVTVGDDVVIAAGSVVRHDIPTNSLAAGNPATPIETLDEFERRQAERAQQGPRYSSDDLSGEYRERQRMEVIEAGVGWSY